MTPAGGAGVEVAPLHEVPLTPAPGAPHLSRISPENPPTPHDDTGAAARVSAVEKAVAIAAERICAEHRPDRPAAYLVSVSKRLRREHHDLAMRLAGDGATSDEIADHVVAAERRTSLPDQHPTDSKPSPLDAQAAAALRRMADNAARIADEPTPDPSSALESIRRIRGQVPETVA